MKIQIEISEDKKILRVEESVNLEKLVSFMQEHFLDKWKEFTLEITPITIWQNPIIIEKHIEPYNPYYHEPWTRPWTRPWITYYDSQTFTSDNIQLNCGNYNVEIK